LTKPSSTKPPESQYTFFTDADLGEMIPRALEEIGFSVERHRAHFSGPTKDPIWLAEVGRRGWIALTHDKRQRRRRDEVDAIMTSGLAAFRGAGTRQEVGRNGQRQGGDVPQSHRMARPAPSGGAGAIDSRGKRSSVAGRRPSRRYAQASRCSPFLSRTFTRARLNCAPS
jgi:hypothetical protein